MIQVPFPKTQPEMQAKNSNGSATKTVGTPPILKNKQTKLMFNFTSRQNENQNNNSNLTGNQIRISIINLNSTNL
jgi:hypothetical protein